jgi:predicted nucleic acid-binding protein
MVRFPSPCVSDTTLLVDLRAGGILRQVFKLSTTWLSPDVVLGEIETELAERLLRLGLQKRELSGDQVEEVAALAQHHLGPSRADLFCIVLAKAERATLVTSDKSLREAAAREGISVHGTLWVLDQVVKHGLVTRPQTAVALQRMVDNNRWLPASEVAEHLRRWRHGGG